MNKKCSVCKQVPSPVIGKQDLHQCRCGFWKPGVNEEWVFWDAQTKKPTLHFLINQ